MDSISKSFSNFSTTLSNFGTPFDGINTSVPVDLAGNKTNPLGRSIDNFLRGVFSDVPGVLAKAPAQGAARAATGGIRAKGLVGIAAKQRSRGRTPQGRVLDPNKLLPKRSKKNTLTFLEEFGEGETLGI